MEVQAPVAKRLKFTMASADLPPIPAVETNLIELLETKQWVQAMERARSYPQEIVNFPDSVDPSPLALACRLGAPCPLVQMILDAAPHKLRHVLDSRGTPLHEAIVCEHTGVEVIDVLLAADEMIGTQGSMRATLLQDVDGFTPLHLLIRRRFQTHILNDAIEEDELEEGGGDEHDSKTSTTSTSGLMQILERLVSSCPEAVIVPDRGEYEEPPIVYAIKANIYSPSLGSEDETLVRIERQIYEMVAIMLKYNPSASSCVFTGYRGQYTALHSAVFHGRDVNTIDLLIQAEQHAQARSESSLNAPIVHRRPNQAALLANTQGEMPLHFCAMRGERPCTVALLARAAPQAVSKRDASGLTPFHWLWIRFVSTLLAIEDSDGSGSANSSGNTTITLNAAQESPFETNAYNCFTALEQGEFDSDLQLFKRMDPPVDFLNMRHIPPEMLTDGATFGWAHRSVEVLRHIRARYQEQQREKEINGQPNDTILCTWTRREVVMSLFWNKAVSLLSALQLTGPEQSSAPVGESVLVPTAFASHSCPPAVAFIAASLFPNELHQPDERGRLPIHYAASRSWHAFDWPSDDSLNEPTAAQLLRKESLIALKTALALSEPQALRVCDHSNRLPLHYVIDAFVEACCTRGAAAAAQAEESSPADEELNGRSHYTCPFQDMLSVVNDMIQRFPESLLRRDGVTKLYPFLQATSTATEMVRTQSHATTHHGEQLSLSLTFQLLRDCPSLLIQLKSQAVGTA